MLYSKLLYCSALFLGVAGAGPIEAGEGELVELVEPVESVERSSLEELLHRHVNAIIDQPRDGSGLLPVSQEIVGKLEVALDLILDRLPEAVDDYGACNRGLNSLQSCPEFSYQVAAAGRDCVHLYQAVDLLDYLGHSYRRALNRVGEFLELWGECKLGPTDDLAKFLRAGVEALRIDCEMGVHCGKIFGAGPEFFQCSQEYDDPNAAGRIRENVFAKYEALAYGAVEQFGRMVKELESVLSGLGDGQRTKAYEPAKRFLDDCFDHSMRFSLGDLKKRDEEFKTGDGWTLSEVQASMRVRMFEELLEFKLKFPKLDHTLPDSSIFFSAYFDPHGARCDGGLYLIDSGMLQRELGLIDVLLDPEGSSMEPSQPELRCDVLRGWVYSLYCRLSGDESMFHEEDGKGLRSVEENLCMALDAIKLADKRRGLYTLGRLIADFEPIAVMIEALKVLHGARQLGIQEGGAGQFLVKLRQVIGKVLREGSAVKNAQMMRGPKGEGYCPQ